jgi:RNA polymerase sigma-70 factor (ECF subfamily)
MSSNESTNSRPDPTWVVEAVRRIQDGRDVEESFRQLFDHYFDVAWRWLRARGLSPETAEDLAQDVMTRVYNGIGRFRWGSSFNTWTLRVVTNVYKNHLRHLESAPRKAESESLDQWLADEESGLRVPPAGLAAADPDPQEAALAAERGKQLSALLNELPPRMRQCFLLRCQGFRYREIARMLGVGADTVKKQLAEARWRLLPVLGSVAGLFTVLWALWLGG